MSGTMTLKAFAQPVWRPAESGRHPSEQIVAVTVVVEPPRDDRGLSVEAYHAVAGDDELTGTPLEVAEVWREKRYMVAKLVKLVASESGYEFRDEAGGIPAHGTPPE